MPKRVRLKSYNDLLSQTSKLMARAGAGGREVFASQPVNYIGNGRIAADRNAATSDKNYARMQRIANIFNRYADNIGKNNPDLTMAYTGRESGARIDAARSAKHSAGEYMRGEKPIERQSTYKQRDGKARREELRKKFANRSNNAAKANGGQG